MKPVLSAAFAISLSVVVSSFAAEKADKKTAGKKPSTLPPTSKMIVLTPPGSPAIASGDTSKLISSEMSGKDLQFFTAAVDAGRFQAYLVDLLKNRAESEQIKALGNALSSTQEMENKQVARLAALKGWTVSTEPTAAQKAVGANLEKEQGPNFDKAVMDKLIAASQQSVGAYEAAGQSADGDIKNLSGYMLPMAREKLVLVEKMTGAGKKAAQFFRTGTPMTAPGATPTPGAPPKVDSSNPSQPAIIPAKPKPATPSAIAAPPATPSSPAKPIQTPIPK
jgi:predicted outer membrane protein